MKYLFLLFLPLVFMSMRIGDERKTLLCHKWMQFAFKGNNEVLPHTITKDMAKECVFKIDGNYEESMYNNMFKASGKWFFNADQSKMDYTITNLNGKNLPEFPNAKDYTNIIILKLNHDTLIYGHEAYYGKDKVYGHDDWYFVREE